MGSQRDLRIRAGIQILLLSTTLSGCGGQNPYALTPPVIIELDAFSGRPNPTWVLTEAQADDLRRMLENIPAMPERPLPSAVLGYRGFRIQPTGSPSSGSANTFYVAGGAVWVESSDGDPVGVLRDTQGIESWLMEQARQRGFPYLSAPP